MTPEDTLTIVRRYHRGWSSRDFETAIDQLAATLEVEVPINSYPTREAFAQALRGFGALVNQVDLLSEMATHNEAMLLYDLHADALGSLRVAEHFTLANGQIVRLRQIHDTAPVRAAGLG